MSKANNPKATALNKFAEEMKAMGLDERFFVSEYGDELWFLGVYNEVLSLGIDEDTVRKAVINKMLNQISKIGFGRKII